MAHLADITATVTAEEAGERSISTLLYGISTKIRDLKNDPSALDALAGELQSKAGELNVAIAANPAAAPKEAPASAKTAPARDAPMKSSHDDSHAHTHTSKRT